MSDDLAVRQARDTAALARALVRAVPLPHPCTWGDDAWHRAATRLTRAVPYTWRLLLAEERAKTRGGEPALMPCGHINADGHVTYDPDCGACVATNSDAPEWTI